VEREVVKSGFNVMRELGGHGVGRTIHEDPPVPNFCDRSCGAKLFEGLVIAVEPIIAAGKGHGGFIARRMDDSNSRPKPVRPLRAHRRYNQRRADSPHGLKAGRFRRRHMISEILN